MSSGEYTEVCDGMPVHTHHFSDSSQFNLEMGQKVYVMSVDEAFDLVNCMLRTLGYAHSLEKVQEQLNQIQEWYGG